MTFGHTSGTVTLAEPPRVDGADTVAMTTATRTVVESGSETNGQASTAQAYLDGHVVVVTLVTDPGESVGFVTVYNFAGVNASSIKAPAGWAASSPEFGCETRSSSRFTPILRA